MNSKPGLKGLKRTGKTGAISFAMELILVVAVVILLLAGMNAIFAKSKDFASESSCRGSVALRDKAVVEVAGVTLFDTSPLLCKTNDVNVLRGTREEIKKQIAELSVRCWFQYYEGKVEDLFRVPEDERGCQICYIFQIDEIKSEEASPLEVVIKEKHGRLKNILTPQEIFNYLMVNRYNPAIVRGGGTKTGIGDAYGSDKGDPYSVKTDIDDPIEVDVNKIKSGAIDSFVIDYTSGKMSSESIRKINELGSKMLQAKAANLLIIVADEFESMERADARKIIQRLELNTDTDTYDALLIMVDLENEMVRTHMGLNLEVYIAEEELHEIMAQAFGQDEENAGQAIFRLVEIISGRLLDENRANLFKKAGINPRSYYAYLSNERNYPVMFDNITKGKTYAITFMSSTNEVAWTRGVINDFRTDFVFRNLFSDDTISQSAQSGGFFDVLFAGAEKANPSNILISELNSVNKYCKIVE